MIEVSEARVDEAAALAQLHLHTATIAYRGIIPEDAEPPTLEALEREWRDAIVDPNTAVLVARRDGLVDGVVVVRAEADSADRAQLSRLYVRPESWRQGIGGRLHDAAVANARDREFASISLWVLERNDRARRFYETKGWSLVVGQLLEWPKLGVREVRYELARS